ncbi:DsbA family protein [Noviherbaspirillum denitrificans]|uniref:Disulfide bond formation protein DsbA n=1 Tax=Noviherbaspirillum denitrificans TaxID=1968433 RepID=A0A254TIC7_9BURK|nr:thioredoxin domain-containing protein [Noviherbaspirillum denitrificans]OWW22386.1 disulfide bond formation protein DsbA [Noviherbaspirillum denitrificans]
MKQKHLFIGTAILLLAAFAAGAFVFKNRQTEEAAQSAAKNREALVRFHSPTVGNADAPVHIVEFFDPACETCKDFYPMVKALMAAHPGKIKVTMRYAPFHQGSDQVVAMLEAARKQGKFWPVLEGLLDAQPYWVKHHAAQPEVAWKVIDSLGLGLDMQRAGNDMQLPEVVRTIQQDLADAQTLNVTKTPEFFVNGKPLPSFGYDQLKKLVDEALAVAPK